jgi:hypothetical protein
VDENEQPLGSAELYQRASGAFESIGSMIAVRTVYTSTALSDGRALIAGGDSSGVSVRTAELFR